MNEIDERVLKSFALWKRDKLDLHTLFEAGGNDPDARLEVFYAVERLVKEGLLQEEGNDFYSLTNAGRKAMKSEK